jgi:hypothetical protein
MLARQHFDEENDFQAVITQSNRDVNNFPDDLIV